MSERCISQNISTGEKKKERKKTIIIVSDLLADSSLHRCQREVLLSGIEKEMRNHKKKNIISNLRDLISFTKPVKCNGYLFKLF